MKIAVVEIATQSKKNNDDLEIENTYHVDFADKDARFWVVKTISWAIYNDKVVTVSGFSGDMDSVHLYRPVHKN